MINSPAIVPYDAVRRKIESEGGKIVGSNLATSILCKAPSGKYFFIPGPLHDDGYTIGQLNRIEITLSAFDIDLLPLDPYRH